MSSHTWTHGQEELGVKPLTLRFMDDCSTIWSTLITDISAYYWCLLTKKCGVTYLLPMVEKGGERGALKDGEIQNYVYVAMCSYLLSWASKPVLCHVSPVPFFLLVLVFFDTRLILVIILTLDHISSFCLFVKLGHSRCGCMSWTLS